MDVCKVFYSRDLSREVDFVVRAGPVVTAIDVKRGGARGTPFDLSAFTDLFRPARSLLVGSDGIPIEDALSRPAEDWVRP